MERHRVRRRGGDQERARGGDAARDDAAPGARDRPAQGVLEGEPVREFLALAHEQVDGEVDAQAEHGDPEERLHDGQLAGQQTHRAQGGADREHQHGRHGQQAAGPLLDDPEQQQHERQADRREPLDRAQGLLLVLRRDRRQAREPRRDPGSDERALDRRFEFEVRAVADLFLQRAERHPDLDQPGAGRPRGQRLAPQRQGGSRETGGVRQVVRSLREPRPAVEQGAVDQPRRLLPQPVDRQRTARRDDGRQSLCGPDRPLDRVVEPGLVAFEQHQQQAAELVAVRDLEVAADVLVVAVHHADEGQIDRRRRQQRGQAERRRDRAGDRAPGRADRPAREGVQELRHDAVATLRRSLRSGHPAGAPPPAPDRRTMPAGARRSGAARGPRLLQCAASATSAARGEEMKFGIMFANTGPFVDGPPAAALAQAAEAAGFDSLWTVEHVVVPRGYASRYPYDESGRMPGGREDFDIPDPLMWLSYVAAATKSIKLATGILIVPQRNPLITAKAVATLDKLSAGRAVLGVGVGWLEEEFNALGVPFAGRGRRLDDYIRAFRALWTEECPSHDGECVSFSDCYSRPQPVQGAVPIVVGGHSDRAARRAGELGDGFFPALGDVERLKRLLGVMRDSAEAAGRDPDAIEITANGGPPDHVARMAELGVSRVIFPPMPPDKLAQFGEDVISKFG